MHSGANVLILDEPTNHLDLESREALEAALSQFPGSLLLVSHDRALLDAVGSRTVALEDRDAAQLRGRLARVRARARGAGQGARPLRRRLPARRRSAAAAKRPAAARCRRSGPRRAPAPQKHRRLGQRAQADPAGQAAKRGSASIEAQIEAAEAALQAVEDELADPAAWATPEASARSTERHAAAKEAVGGSTSSGRPSRAEPGPRRGASARRDAVPAPPQPASRPRGVSRENADY